MLEIIHNLKDEKNEEFRENIINGKIKPEELCTMNSVDMLSKNKKNEIEKKYYNETRARQHLENHYNILLRNDFNLTCHSFDNFTNLEYLKNITKCNVTNFTTNNNNTKIILLLVKKNILKQSLSI